MRKRLTLICAFALFVAAAAADLAASEAAAAPAAAPHARFIVVLDPQSAGEEPFDITKFGGKLERRSGTRMAVTLPESALEGVSKHPRVRYIQRLATGLPVRGGNRAEAAASDALRIPPQSSRFEAATNTVTSLTLGPYSYDGSGNITEIQRGTGVTGDTFRYDRAGRIATAAVTDGATARDESYVYDSTGNLTHLDTWVPTSGGFQQQAIDLPVDSATNRLNAGQTYDASGFMTTSGGTVFMWDSAGMMSSRNEEFFVYTADDERLAVMRISGNEPFWIWTVRDLGGRPLREYDSFGPPDAQEFLWLGDHYYAGGTMIAAKRETAEGGLRHFHLDHLGTPRVMTNVNGERLSKHAYFPFGAEITSSSQDIARGFEREEPLRFTGHERDVYGNVGASPLYLDYMHARFYNAQWGRFLSVDPVLDVEHAKQNPQGWNRYSYVENNPVNATDPNGRCSSVLSCAGWGTGAVGSALGVTLRLIGTAAAMYLSQRTEPVRPLSVPPALSEGVNWGPKIDKQLGKRGWDVQSVHDTINNPDRTYDLRDQRHLPGGVTTDQPATAYVNDDGSYVIVNDVTGEVVQVSDRNDPNWLNPWDKEQPERQREDTDGEKPPK